MGSRELTYGEAVREAVAEEMRRDPHVLLIGEDAAESGPRFRMLSGLEIPMPPIKVFPGSERSSRVSKAGR